MAAVRTVLITGCSIGGLGDALARVLHRRGHRVIATGRNPDKIAHFKDLEIETLILDVQSPESISACIASVAEMTGGSLDMLINNSGAGFTMPLMDSDLQTSKQVFELNFWSVLAVTKAFVPLLMKSKFSGVVVNNTSINSVLPIPMNGIYNASKAAAAMLTDTLRLELRPFNIKVVELKTGNVQSFFWQNLKSEASPTLPDNSLYNCAKADVEKVLKGSYAKEGRLDSMKWADQVIRELFKRSVPAQIWKGGSARVTWFLYCFAPIALLQRIMWKLGGLDIVMAKMKKK